MTVSELLTILSADLYRKGQKRLSLVRLVGIYLFREDSRKAYVLIRLMAFFQANGRPRLSQKMARILRREFGCIISAKAHIGPGLHIPHPVGIVIGEGVRIAERCTIYQQVTIGGARRGDWQAGRYPEIAEDVVLFAGAKLLGAITIGRGSTVGANAVVTRDVPPHHVAVGIPAINKPAREMPPLSREAAGHGETVVSS